MTDELQKDLTDLINKLDRLKSFLSDIRNLKSVANQLGTDDLKQLRTTFAEAKALADELNLELPKQLTLALTEVNQLLQA
jgi:GTP1/Obg family GTP-binding protein